MGSFPETFNDPKGQSAAKSVDKTKKMTKIKKRNGNWYLRLC